MKCPRDGAALARVEILGLDLDKCHQCDGLWCDRGELERLRDAKVEGVEEALERKYGNPQLQKGAVDAHMRCPRCGTARLLEFAYTFVSPVRIDRCEQCHGLWLDAGELNAIVGEKKGLDKAVDAGRLKAFLRAMGKLVGRE
jgi:Zn-finger nucleic acid-binding protein